MPRTLLILRVDWFCNKASQDGIRNNGDIPFCLSSSVSSSSLFRSIDVAGRDLAARGIVEWLNVPARPLCDVWGLL